MYFCIVKYMYVCGGVCGCINVGVYIYYTKQGKI